jgi:hypothetical protein
MMVPAPRHEVKQLKDHKSKDRFHYFSALNKAAQMMTLAGNYSEAEVRQSGMGWVG